MNRYQREVADFDRRHRWTMRGLSFAGAAILIAAALWSAGLPLGQWWMRAQSWFASAPNSSAQPASVPPLQALPSTEAAVNGSASAAQVPAGTDSSTSSTPQPLFLIATSPGRNKKEGTARIGTDMDNPQTYMAGAVLANGAQLAEIHSNYVLLVRGESSAKLELYQRRHSAMPVPLDALLQVGGEPATPARNVTTREVLTEYLRPSPVYDGEMLRGYQVYPGPKAGMFARLGLEAGDVITAINDAPLNDPPQAMEMLDQLTHGLAVVAIIERKSTAQRITLDGALISADQDNAKSAAQLPPSPAGMPSM